MEAAVVDGRLVPGDVSIAGGLIDAVGLKGGGRGLAVPGFIDLQVNGFGGIDLLRCDVEDVHTLGRNLLEHGVTAYQPTIITSPLQEMTEALARIERARRDGGAGARIVGAHVEGPFLSEARCGTHPRDDLLLPDVAVLEALLGAATTSMVTLAPELPGAGALIDLLVKRGICASVGHSNADAATAHAAFDRGARCVTHLFNAMPPLTAREPGVAGAALARDDVGIQIIADGVHVATDTLRVAWRAAAGRIALVSDSIAAAGGGDGAFSIGKVGATVRDGVARRADGTLAGSIGTVADALRRLCAAGVELADAVAAATSVPARLLGRPDLGTIAPGARADVVVLDDALAIARVISAGVDADPAAVSR